MSRISSAYSHLYNSRRWRKLRLQILKRDKWTCQQTGKLLLSIPNKPNSAVVDHITPHKGDEALFWDTSNLQAVTKHYHDSIKQAQEKSGTARLQRSDGW